ncbi:MAG: SUMF1/EgtB/PvdO family nonheme iron enzyme, partial [Saprospiraceae bacterium]
MHWPTNFGATLATLLLTHSSIAQTPPNYPEMLPLPGGAFQMGSRAGDADEKPAHTVVLSSFHLAKTETTLAEFQAFMDSSGYITDAERGAGSFVWDSLGWHQRE